MRSKLYHTTALTTKLADFEAGLALLLEAVGKLRPLTTSIDPALPAGPLAEDIWTACGRHKALVLRTRLAQKAEAEDGYRQPRRGRDLVVCGTKAGKADKAGKGGNGSAQVTIMANHGAVEHPAGSDD